MFIREEGVRELRPFRVHRADGRVVALFSLLPLLYFIYMFVVVMLLVVGILMAVKNRNV